MGTDIRKVDKVEMEAVQSLKKTLEKKGYAVTVLNSEKEVKDFINDRVPDEQIVGLGDSITTCTLNIRNILFSKGSTIFYSWDGDENYNRSLDTFETPIRPAYYLSRINAITTDGTILMKDYSKQAAKDNVFPEQMFLFAGMNRLCENLDNDRESVQKYAVFIDKPAGTHFTVALLPFLHY